MARQQDVDWSDWKGHIDSPTTNTPSNQLKKGADVVKEALTTGKLPILIDAPKQPTKEEFEAIVAAMLPSKEKINELEANWKDAFNKRISEASKPIDHLNKSDIATREWGNGKSFNSILTEEEKSERAMCIDE